MGSCASAQKNSNDSPPFQRKSDNQSRDDKRECGSAASEAQKGENRDENIVFHEKREEDDEEEKGLHSDSDRPDSDVDDCDVSDRKENHDDENYDKSLQGSSDKINKDEERRMESAEDLRKSQEVNESGADSKMGEPSGGKMSEVDALRSDEINEKDDGGASKDELERFELQIKPEEEDKESIKLAILNGQMNIEIPSQVKLVRIFTSSTFTDTFVERNTLMKKVYHKLKEYCQLRGYDFQVVDMRWGVRDEATADHMTSELCMKELKACQQLSTGPNFITFLGQKYGYRPFPPKILEKEFDVMLSSIESEDDVNLLEKWFKRDDNLCPSMYILQPIGELLPNYNNWSVSAEERSKASNEWWQAFERMQVVLRDVSEKTLLNEEEISRYKISVTEDEIRRGIINAKDKKKHCYWFRRRITDIEDHLDKAKSRFFIDKAGKCVDDDAVSLLNDLKSRVETVLDGENIKTYDIKWHGEDGVNKQESEEHKLYISQLCSEFYDVLVDMINKGIEEKDEKNLNDDLLTEVAEHALTCQEKSRTFFGRKEILDSIIKHAESEGKNRLLVVHGESGCGKTSIMAVAARKIKDLHPEIPIVLRFLGTTSQSSTIHDLLRSICTQIYHLIGKAQPDFPEGFQDVIEYFAETLNSVTTKMVIILDSLDQLSSQDLPFNFKWMPKKINRKVTFILSTIPNPEFKVFPVLQARFAKDCFVEVPKLENQSAGFILNSWLRMAGHKLTTNQRQIVLDSFTHCPLPLYLKLSFDRSLRWRSYSPEDKTVLPLTIKGIINGLFTSIERLHGECLVRRSLGYLTAVRFGLSDAEIEDILSSDDEVLNDVYQYWTPPIRRVPPLLWVRIKSDLEAYVISRGADGVLVNTWHHRQFFETAKERYLQPDVVKGIHAQIADFFQGKWANGTLKPFVSKDGKEDEKDRLVSAQPNIFSDENGENAERFNYRKLNELPFHLIRAGDIKALRKNFSSNFDFLQTKLRACGFRELLQDFKDAAEAFPDEKEVELIGKCIEMSGKSLLDDPFQLAGQLTCRMSHLEDYDGIRSLLAQARSANVKCLYSTINCFPGPGGSLLHSLSGHKSSINWTCLSKDGKKLVSISEDETLKVWDTDSGEEIQSFDMEASYSDIRFYNEDNCVVVAGSYRIFAMELDTEEIVYEEDVDGLYGKCIDVMNDGKTMVHIGEEKVRVYQIDGQKITFRWEYEETTEENSDGVSDIVSGSRNWYAYTRGNVRELIVRKPTDQEFEKKIEVPYGLRHFQFHEDQLITLGTNSEFQTLTEMHLVIWDTSKWEIISDRLSQFHPMVSTMYDITLAKTKFGLELIWPVFTQINFWNLETGKERVTLRMGVSGSYYRQAISNDGKRLAVSEIDINKLSIEVYDLDFLEYDDQSDSDFSELDRFKRYAGTGEKDAYLSDHYPTTILSLPYSDPSTTIWNTGYQVPLRTIQFVGSMPLFVKYIDDERIALLDHQRKKVICVNFIKSKVESVTKGHTGEMLSHYEMWHRIGSDKLLTTAEVETEMVLWDLKTGDELKRYKINREESIISFMVSEDESTALVALRDKSNIDAKLPAICIDLASQEIRSTVAIDDQYLQLEPSKSVLAQDGTIVYLVLWSDCIYKVDTATGKTIRKIYYKAEGESGEDIEKMTVFYCINSSSAMGYLVTYLMCHVNDEAVNRLVVYDYEANDLLAWHNSAMYQDTQISKDGCRMLCISSPMTEQLKALEIWDMSKVKEGQMTMLARFVPDSFLRFNYLTADGRMVCCGFTGAAGVVFLSLCGYDSKLKKDKECVDVTIDLSAVK